ncbi:hypothetical protein GCM10028864_05610 [Microlunatus parietis]
MPTNASTHPEDTGSRPYEIRAATTSTSTPSSPEEDLVGAVTSSSGLRRLSVQQSAPSCQSPVGLDGVRLTTRPLWISAATARLKFTPVVGLEYEQGRKVFGDGAYGSASPCKRQFFT